MESLETLSRSEMRNVNGGYIDGGGCSFVPCDIYGGYIACCCRDGSKTCIHNSDVTACANFCSGHGPY